MTRKALFEAARGVAPITPPMVPLLDKVADLMGFPRGDAQKPASALKAAIATPKGKTQAGALVGVVGLACATVLTPFITDWESSGKPRLVAYKDIVGVWTICDGETKGVRAGQTDTLEGCAMRLDKRLAEDFAPAVKACTPSIASNPYRLTAAISLAYNVGVGAYCKSTVDRRFDAGDITGACDAFLLWNKAGGRVVAGLTRRREAERALCLRN